MQYLLTVRLGQCVPLSPVPGWLITALLRSQRRLCTGAACPFDWLCIACATFVGCWYHQSTQSAFGMCYQATPGHSWVLHARKAQVHGSCAAVTVTTSWLHTWRSAQQACMCQPTILGVVFWCAHSIHRLVVSLCTVHSRTPPEPSAHTSTLSCLSAPCRTPPPRPP
jgi:hypothetical protein